MIVPDMKATREVDPTMAKMLHEADAFEMQIKAAEDGFAFANDDDEAQDLRTRIEVLEESLTKANAEIEDYVGDEAPERIIIGFVPSAELVELDARSYKASGDVGEYMAIARDLCRKGIRGWRGFIDASGGLVAFDIDICMDLLERHDMVPAMAAQIRKYNKLTEDDRRK